MVLIIGVTGELLLRSHAPEPQISGPGPALTNLGTIEQTSFGKMVPRTLAPAPVPARLDVGARIETKVGERRCMAFPDGGLVIFDQQTRAQVIGPGQLRLETGAACCDGAKMTIQTTDRTTTIDEGRMEVRVVGDQSSIYVANGIAVVFPYQRLPEGTQIPALSRGYQFRPGEWEAVPAPRASSRLDWTRDLVVASETLLVPANSNSGGALRTGASGQETELSLRKYHVDVQIEDGFARTTIDQTYFNYLRWRVEGTFYFPLPPDASLSRLAMYVDGKLMEGGMAERDYARTVFHAIVSKQRDPALLEWVDGSTFKMRVFPLEGRQEKRIILSYVQRLPSLYGKTTYRFPAGHSLNAVRDWSFTARVKKGAALQWGSLNHPGIQGVRDGVDLVLTDAAQNVKLEHDIVVNLHSPTDRPFSQDIRFSSAELDGAKYLMLRFRPELPHVLAPNAPRNWVFLFESAASRDPLLARAQAEVIAHLLHNIDPGDTFDVLTVGTHIQRLSPTPLPVNPENIAKTADYLSKTHLIGATNLGAAFEEAAALLHGSGAWLVHVGAGYATLGVREEQLARLLPGGVRYLGIGVGRRWNRAFMKQLAEQTGGHFTQINPDESIAWRAFDLAAALNTPRLTAATVTANGPDKPALPMFREERTEICQGEELCAAARLMSEDGTPLKMPESVTIRGRLEGQEFSTTIPVQDVAPGAGYLPRAWAKLEIDRMVAENSSANHERIVKLSKEMYVMSPFTSLLVLENDAMYAQYKVDRGRKDHWALYPCPPQIPIVYEPDAAQLAADRNASDGSKPSTFEVLGSILMRAPSAWNTAGGHEEFVTAADRYWHVIFNARTELAKRRSGSVDDPFDESRVYSQFRLLNFFEAAAEQTIRLEPPGRDRLFRLESEDALKERWRQDTGSPETPTETNINGVPTDERSLGSSDRRSGKNQRQITSEGLVELGSIVAWEKAPQDWNPLFDPITGLLLNEALVKQGGGNPERIYYPPALALEFKGFSRGPQSAHFPDLTIVDNTKPAIPDRNRYQMTTIKVRDTDDLALAGLVGGERSGTSIATFTPAGTSIDSLPSPGEFFAAVRMYGIYGVPLTGPKDLPPSDPLAYAPGLRTTDSDIQGILESEAAPSPDAAIGIIQPEARQLIESARTAGWYLLSIGISDGKHDVALSFDGAGHYEYERTTATGLLERVICDGKTLLHLYPELGVGARRVVNRFHRAEFNRTVPWLVLPAEDYAHGADVRLLDKNTVAVTAHGRQPEYVLHLVFDKQRLCERRIVDLATQRIVRREVYARDGSLHRFDATGMEVLLRRYEIKETKAADLRPDTSALVMLTLPYRSREFVSEKYGLPLSQASDKLADQWFECLPTEAVEEYLSTAFATKNLEDARTLFDGLLSGLSKTPRGLFAVLKSCGLQVTKLPAFRRALKQSPRDPLLRYLALQESDAYRASQSYLPFLWDRAIATDGLLPRLARFHELVQRWQSEPLPATGEFVRSFDVSNTLAFVRENPQSPFSLFILNLAGAKLSESRPRVARELARARGIIAERVENYSNDYERARLLFEGGRKDEAAQRFRDLYQRELKRGYLPPIGEAMRESLLADGAWVPLIKNAAASLIRAKQRPLAIALAWQTALLRDPILAEELLRLALDGASPEEQLSTTLSAIQYRRYTGALAGADSLLQTLLSNDRFAKDSRLWRLHAEFANELGKEEDALTALGHALDIEYHELPDQINATAWQADYEKVLNYCRGLAEAAKLLGAKPPEDLLARTIRTADRCRIYSENPDKACTETATVLSMLGESDLAWDYLTSAIAMQDAAEPKWAELAVERNRTGDFATAERAFQAACAAAPDNAMLLWQRSANLRQSGRTSEADKLVRQLAEQEWPENYAHLQRQARQLMGKK
jgi:hypothetical protein